jgi:poly-gamma-glutamate system protein
MKHPDLNIRLLILFLILLAGTLISLSFFRKQRPLPYSEEMNRSVELTEDMFAVIQQLKLDRNIVSDAHSSVPFGFMIGDEWSDITTTLGSLEAKEISTNPEFSALIVRLMLESGISAGDRVGIIMSGSFPSLAISALAAIQTIGAEAVVMSSVGSSTYGANQPGATWLDMATALGRQGLIFNTVLVSIGAGDDAGIGLSDEGLSIARNAAYRNKVDLYVPSSLLESINKRVEIFKDEKISLLINIGGNETALGNCAQSLSIPNGLNARLSECNDKYRGVITRMNETGIPFINMLDIKDLASRYGLDISPGTVYSESDALYNSTTTNKPVIAVILAISVIPVLLLRKRTHI